MNIYREDADTTGLFPKPLFSLEFNKISSLKFQDVAIGNVL